MSVYKGQITLWGKVREELFRCTLDSGQHVEVSLTLGCAGIVVYRGLCHS